MKELLATLKTELKVLASEIRALKKTRKQCANGYVSKLAIYQFEFRTKHIFRCLLRGRTLQQIESSRLVNPPLITSYPEIQLHVSVSHSYLQLGVDYHYRGIYCHCASCRKVRDEQTRCDNQA